MKSINYANRGLAFEGLINYSNEMYESRDIALIKKRPTPVTIMKKYSGGGIEGRLEKKSTVDYEGRYRGRPIDFEAKETHELTRFPLSMIDNHQYHHLENAQRHGSIAFVLVSFAKHQTVYLIPFTTIQHYWQRRGARGMNSIPISDLDVCAYQVSSGRVPIDYLAVVDRIWRGGISSA